MAGDSNPRLMVCKPCGLNRLQSVIWETNLTLVLIAAIILCNRPNAENRHLEKITAGNISFNHP